MIEVSDAAVLTAVNIQAIVHNMLGRLDLLNTEDEHLFWRKVYELRDYYERHAPEREQMRLEWVRRCKAKDEEWC